jgi:hypothetical protein
MQGTASALTQPDRVRPAQDIEALIADQPSLAPLSAHALVACGCSAKPAHQQIWLRLFAEAKTAPAVAEITAAFAKFCREDSSEAFVRSVPTALLQAKLVQGAAPDDPAFVSMLAAAQRLHADVRACENDGVAANSSTTGSSVSVAPAAMSALACCQSALHSIQHPSAELSALEHDLACQVSAACAGVLPTLPPAPAPASSLMDKASGAREQAGGRGLEDGIQNNGAPLAPCQARLHDVVVALQRVLTEPALKPAEAQAVQTALSALTSVVPGK